MLKSQTWKDASISCDADGWTRNRPDINWIKELIVDRMEPFRRVPEENWFKLIGAVGDNDEEYFVLGTRKVTYIPKKSDEFCPFANDLRRMYSNNDGHLKITITREPD
ncbi:MAG: hypothetical protein P1U80_06935 [Pseudomonadales bacterium]|nr:hypothetical protein [Pseudomonadales bacterium]